MRIKCILLKLLGKSRERLKLSLTNTWDIQLPEQRNKQSYQRQRNNAQEYSNLKKTMHTITVIPASLLTCKKLKQKYCQHCGWMCMHLCTFINVYIYICIIFFFTSKQYSFLNKTRKELIKKEEEKDEIEIYTKKQKKSNIILVSTDLNKAKQWKTKMYRIWVCMCVCP